MTKDELPVQLYDLYQEMLAEHPDWTVDEFMTWLVDQVSTELKKEQN